MKRASDLPNMQDVFISSKKAWMGTLRPSVRGKWVTLTHFVRPVSRLNVRESG